MAKRLVIHIGLAKTGTTSFQHSCHGHRRLLARHGLLYPRAMCGLARNHSPLASSYLAHRPHDPTISTRVVPRAEAVAALIAEIDASPCPVALLSSEHLSMHFDPYEADQLAADFAAYEPLIVVALREPYARFLSMWNTQVTAGGALTLEEFGRSLLVTDNRFFSIREILRVWRAAFPPDRVRIIDYDGTRDIAGAILDACGVAARLPEGPRRRASLPLATTARLRALNAAITARQTAPQGTLAAWAQHSAFSMLAQRRLARDKVPNVPPVVSPQTMAMLDTIYENDRAWLAETYGFALTSTRDRYVIGDPPPPSRDEAAAAEALLRQVSRGLWAPSQALVAAYERTRKLRG